MKLNIKNKLRGTTFNQELHDELIARYNNDQDIRKAFIKPSSSISESDKANAKKIDTDNVTWLKKVLEQYGWPGKSLVGEDGAFAVYIIAQHADLDTSFQEKCLGFLKESVSQGEADGKNLAYLTDRVAYNKKVPQIYGTQMTSKDNQFVPYPIEDIENVDTRRGQVGLPPLKTYIDEFNTSFGKILKKEEPKEEVKALESSSPLVPTLFQEQKLRDRVDLLVDRVKSGEISEDSLKLYEAEIISNRVGGRADVMSSEWNRLIQALYMLGYEGGELMNLTIREARNILETRRSKDSLRKISEHSEYKEIGMKASRKYCPWCGEEIKDLSLDEYGGYYCPCGGEIRTDEAIPEEELGQYELNPSLGTMTKKRGSRMKKESSTKDKYLLSVLMRKARRVSLLERTAGEEPSKEDSKTYAKYVLQNSEFLANEIDDYLGKTGKNIEGIPDEIWAETAKELGFTKGSLVTEDGKLFHMKGKPVVYASKDTTSKKELEACDKTNKETKEEPKKKSEEKKATKEVIAEVQVTDSNGNALFEGDLVYTDDDYFGTIAEIKDKDTVVVSMGKYNSFLREYHPYTLTK